MSIGKRIKEKREQLCLLQTDLAKNIGVTKQTLYKYENEIITNIPSDKIELIAKYLNVSPSYLMGWEDETTIPQYDNIHPVTVKKVPMLGEIACGKPILANEDRESYIMLGTDIDVDFCLKAHGDSMTGARIYDGDIIFIRQMSEVENGEIAAVAIGDEATLKRVYYNKENNFINLIAENPAYPPMTYTGEQLNEVHILGRAIAFQSDIK